MALISPTNLLTLHSAGKEEITQLRWNPSDRYDYFDSSDKNNVPIVPDTALFDNLPKGDPKPKSLPTASECAVHLEMLEVFRTLRDEVIQSMDVDGAFCLSPEKTFRYRRKRTGWKYVAQSVLVRDPTWEDRRKLKWKYFLSIAATRFHIWISMVNGYLKKAAAGVPPSKDLLLPPVDVLVIWHGFLLNCDDFKEYCDKHDLKYIQDIVFPWADIHAAINPDTWKYTLPPDHSKWLNVHALAPDLLAMISKEGVFPGPARPILLSFVSYDKWSTDRVGYETNPFVRTVKTALTSMKANEPLVENVERQCVFVDKMHAHRWIRSPAASGTLNRAVDRYDKFLHLFRLYPNQFFVPTLDVDLAWHTHQCSAQNYRTFVTDRVGRFINHEDKIGRNTLNDGFTMAEQWYRLTFGEQYQVCLCWSCEAILSAVEALDEVVLDDEAAIDKLVKDVEQTVHYHRELETARRLGKELPVLRHK